MHYSIQNYTNFGLASSVVQTSQVRLGSVNSCGRDDASPEILQRAFDNISQLALAAAIFLVFTIRQNMISNTTVFFHFHLNIWPQIINILIQITY